ncbi:MAG: D-2-hydroxyacid dehydrogenase [Planctomycetota bacterium]|nr:D-2-hydroxyacid dehydrogenase [Planctomycetota bacterium]
MPKWKIVFLDAMTFDREDVSFKQFTDSWECVFHRFTKPGETAGRLLGADVVVSNKIPIDEKVLASPEAKSLKLIAVAATGFNNVEIEAAKRRGIPVCNVRGYSSASVAQHTFGLILELANHCGRYTQDVAAGAWSKSPIFTLLTYPCVELEGKTLGIVGHGDIGKSVAKIAEGFGMKVLAAGRKGQANVPEGRTPFDVLLQQSDVVTLHCPLTPETKNIIGKDEFGLMKKSAFLINASRGGLVDEAALIEALKGKWIAGAGFDVATREPAPADHPLVLAAKELDNLVVTPHSAWSTLESRQRLLDEIGANIRAFESGKERNRVG